ncbi:P pilus assembly chaperone PapD [Enterobacillus tribolii]|uniref:P pilus assembly chaperone PapD n=2 Tax=Enterobacillus tribolii TaxID=1487935 RepID=A0A370R2A8_9GAMM|nr:pilus assembly protein [Enterobacillus tribolii]RDK96052.1 P pilus assembly chaperone PapD [Enterobacillus tribolii]
MEIGNLMFSKITGIFFTFALLTNVASAGMTITGTRIIFPSDEREVTVRTNNRGASPSLVQVWVDDGKVGGDINKVNTPFVVTPPVYRVEPGKGQSVRLVYNGMSLPQDRESVFWFNMLEVPPVDKKAKNADVLELAFRTRIKIFYRPSSLKSSSINDLDKLTWQQVNTNKGRGIKVSNPTPYYVSFESASIEAGNRKYALETEMVEPFGSKTFSVSGNQSVSTAINSIDINILNDYGATVNQKLVAQGGGFIHRNAIKG